MMKIYIDEDVKYMKIEKMSVECFMKEREMRI